MYFCDKGIVLRHRDIREFDRIVTIFTKNHGRLEVLFKGVRKPQAKLRSFSELMCHSDFRLYSSKYGTLPLCIGAGLINDYAKVRMDIEKMVNFLFVSDVIVSITPLNQKSIEKYELIISALNYLLNAEVISKWFKVVFVMNTLHYFGTGFKNIQFGYDDNFWQAIHSGFDCIKYLDHYDELYEEVSKIAFDNLNEYTSRIIDPSKYDILIP